MHKPWPMAISRVPSGEKHCRQYMDRSGPLIRAASSPDAMLTSRMVPTRSLTAMSSSSGENTPCPQAAAPAPSSDLP